MRLLLGLCFACLSLQAFEKKPWMGDFLQFEFSPSFTYRKYPSVNRAYNPKKYSSNDRFTNLDLKVAFLPSCDLEMGIEFADTKKQSLGTQSAGIQLRYQWLDDIPGDIISFTSGLNVRWVSTRSLQDVSCPYHYTWNFEVVNAIGKEFIPSEDLLLRTYGFIGIGQAITGMPWVRGSLSLEAYYQRAHHFQLFGESYFGFGKQRVIDIDKFYGYAKVFHQSIDVGAIYTYTVSEIWGKVFIGYTYRVLAKAFPAHANTFTIGYNFPFSLF